MYRNTRRLFLSALGAGFASLCVGHAPGRPISIRREVSFPREMDWREYEALSAASHDYPSIIKFNARMIERGFLQETSFRYEKDRAIFDHTFTDEESYKFWLANIDQSWFDLARFEADGFRVSLYRIG